MSQEASCNICLECFTKDNFLSLSCNCSFCPSCLYEWILASLKIYNVDIMSPLIKCPNEKCSQTFPINQLKDLLIKEQNSTIDEILLLKYLQSTEDVRSCPSSDCHYYGYIPKKTCQDSFECLKCGNVWEDERNWIKKQGFWRILSNDVFSLIYEEFFTKSCPKCGIFIYRTGGCQHMTCKKCNYEFCWACKQDFKAHIGNICVLNQIIRMVLIIFHVVLGLWKFDIVNKIFAIFALFIHFILKYLLFYNGFFALALYFLNCISNFLKYRYNERSSQGIFGLTTVAALLIYCIFLLSIFGDFSEFFGFIVGEIVLVFSGLIIGLVFNFIWISWLYNVE